MTENKYKNEKCLQLQVFSYFNFDILMSTIDVEESLQKAFQSNLNLILVVDKKREK